MDELELPPVLQRLAQHTRLAPGVHGSRTQPSQLQIGTASFKSEVAGEDAAVPLVLLTSPSCNQSTRGSTGIKPVLSATSPVASGSLRRPRRRVQCCRRLAAGG